MYWTIASSWILAQCSDLDVPTGNLFGGKLNKFSNHFWGSLDVIFLLNGTMSCFGEKSITLRQWAFLIMCN